MRRQFCPFKQNTEWPNKGENLTEKKWFLKASVFSKFSEIGFFFLNLKGRNLDQPFIFSELY